MAALTGMRVLDMTQYEAGTSCTQALAWLGADVVKVEPPEGDPGRQIMGAGTGVASFGSATLDSQYFLNYNSNKRSLVLNLARPEGRDLLLRMVPRFNVFVENFGPGVIEKLNIGYDIMHDLNPGLIYARIKGFGLSGPYAKYRVFDPLAQAAAGSVSTTGDAAGPPGQPGPSLADSGTGLHAALAITAAYVQFLNSGAGQQIELSMQEAMLAFMKTRFVSGWNADEPVPRRLSLGSAPSGMFPCSPGGPNDYVYFSVVTSRMWDTLCIAIGRPALATDERFATPQARSANVGALREEISAWTIQHSKHEAMKIAAEAGVPASAVFDSVDVFNDPHLHQRGFFQTVRHAANGDVTLMKNPIRMSESPTEIVPAPLKGEHSREVLSSELGLSDAELDQLESLNVIHAHGIPRSGR